MKLSKSNLRLSILLIILIIITVGSIYYMRHQGSLSADTVGQSPCDLFMMGDDGCMALFKQDGFRGGQTSDIKNVNWNAGSFNQYSSLDNLSLSLPADPTYSSQPYISKVDLVDNSRAGYIYTPVYLQGSDINIGVFEMQEGYFAKIAYDIAAQNHTSADQSIYPSHYSRVEWRIGDTVAELQSASWQTPVNLDYNSYCSTHPYFQFRVKYNPNPTTQYYTTMILVTSSGLAIDGDVRDSLTGQYISAHINFNGSPLYNNQLTNGFNWWQYRKVPTTSFKLTVSKDGYKAFSTDLPVSACPFRYYNYAGDNAIKLVPLSSSGESSGTPSTSTPSSLPGTKPVSTKKTPTKTTPQSTQASLSTSPSKPTLTVTTFSKTIDGIATILATTDSPVVRDNQTFSLSGTTNANAKVILTIKSDPITQEITADKEGKWSYTLDPKALKLAYGEHNVSAIAEVNSQKSDTVELAKFTFKASVTTSTPLKTEPYNLFSIANIILFGIVVILLVGLVFLKVKGRKRFIQKSEL